MTIDSTRPSEPPRARRTPDLARDGRLDAVFRTPETASWRSTGEPPWGSTGGRSTGPFDPGGRRVSSVVRWLGPVLAGAPFPARLWQLLAQADLNGADSHTRRVLTHLAEQSYAGVSEVAEALAAVPPTEMSSRWP